MTKKITLIEVELKTNLKKASSETRGLSPTRLLKRSSID